MSTIPATDLADRLRTRFAIPLDASPTARAEPAACWARSGAMALTGDPDGPPLAAAAPAALVMADAGRVLDSLAPGVVDDAPALLGERAALLGLRRAGHVSCGGATRLLPAGDGWLAVALARPDDWDLLPAWLGAPAGTWDEVALQLADRPRQEATDAASLLGLPVSAVPATTTPGTDPWSVDAIPTRPVPRTGPPLVVDLSALWAGPLCADLLGRAGATVIKVEDPHRPDGARFGPPAFFDLLNAAKRSVAVDLRSDALPALLGRADVIVTSARRRAFDHLGIDPRAVLAASPTVWVAITAYGWDSQRVGFGDDVAAGSGLVAWHPRDAAPRFAGDAVADPLCGTLAAIAALAALRTGGSWFVDASLAAAAAYACQGRSGPAVAATQAAGGLWLVDGQPVANPRVARSS